MLAEASQPGILSALSTLGRSFLFRLADRGALLNTLAAIREQVSPAAGVVGLGAPLTQALGKEIPGLRSFPDLTNPRCNVPATQEALWVCLRGANHDAIFEASERLRMATAPAFALVESLDTFLYAGGRDLTGYEDGTENPRDEEAIAAAIDTAGASLNGSSFVAVQKWRHDLAKFRAMPKALRDHTIGREQVSNEELDDAPESAHVKRTAQEEFTPPAFMVRRSMPWDNGVERGLLFVAYGNTLDKYEAVMRRMAGFDDGIVDALFTYSQPVSGGYYWCPPLRGGKFDFSLLGVS